MTQFVRGQQVSLVAEFVDGNVAAVFAAPVAYQVQDPNGLLVASGTCIQDSESPEKWSATFTLPANLPITQGDGGQRFKIVWSGQDVAGGKHRATEHFEVLNATYEELKQRALAVLVGRPFADSLLTQSPISGYTVELRDVKDNVHYTATVTNPEAAVHGQYFQYEHSFDNETVTALVAGAVGIYPYQIHWTYSVAGQSTNEMHPLYVFNGKVMHYVHTLREYLDMAQLDEINPALRYTDLALAHHLLVGLARINAEPPSLTSWTLNSLPDGLSFSLKAAAAVEALNARYLAEGMSSFDFQGQSVQLSVDRTQFLSYKIDENLTYLNDKLRAQKKMAVRSSSAGVLGVNFGTMTNVSAPLNNELALYHLRQTLQYQGFLK